MTSSREMYDELSFFFIYFFPFFKLGNVIFLKLETALQRHGRVQEFAQRDVSRK